MSIENNYLPQHSTEFLFHDDLELSDKELKTYYSNRFNELKTLIESKKLLVHSKKLPDPRICKANTCFILDRQVTSGVEKIILGMGGYRYNCTEKRKIHRFGIYEYIDGKFKENPTLGIRVVKASKEIVNQDEYDDEYSNHFKHVLVHFYTRTKNSNPNSVITRHLHKAPTPNDDEESELSSSDESDLDESYRISNHLRVKKPENQPQQKVERNNSKFQSKFQNEDRFQQSNDSVDRNLDEEIAQTRKALYDSEREICYQELYLYELQEQILQIEMCSSSKNQQSNYQPFNNKVKLLS